MARGEFSGVTVDGLRELRRDLRAMERDLIPEFRVMLKDAFEPTAEIAAFLAPKRTSYLASRVRTRVQGANVAIGALGVPYGNVIHWGGNVPPRSRPLRPGEHRIHIEANPFVLRALDFDRDNAVDRLGDKVEAFAGRHGFIKRGIR